MAAPTFRLGPQTPITFGWIKKGGEPETSFAQYMIALDDLVRGYTGGFTSLVAAANDGAAAAAGVQIGQLYQNAGAVRIRLT